MIDLCINELRGPTGVKGPGKTDLNKTLPHVRELPGFFLPGVALTLIINLRTLMHPYLVWASQIVTFLI